MTASTSSIKQKQTSDVVHVQVVHPIPAIRLGIETILRDNGVYVLERIESDGVSRGADLIPDVLLVDLDGLDVPGPRSRSPGLTIIVLAESESMTVWTDALEADADGVISLQWPPRSIVLALFLAMEGVVAVPRRIATRSIVERRENELLTTNEERLLRDLARGYTIERLAESHSYSSRTISRMLSRIYLKLGASCRIEAIATATAQGLLSKRRSAHIPMPTYGMVMPPTS